jgi:hypothetical protein
VQNPPFSYISKNNSYVAWVCNPYICRRSLGQISALMKNLLLAIAPLVFICSPVFGQNSETRSIGSFSGVKVSEGIDVYLKKGTKESLRVEATDIPLEDIVTEVSGSYLKIHMRDVNHRRDINAKVYVTYVMVDKISASSAGSVFSEDPIKADEIEVSVSSAGSIEISVNAKSVDVSASSAGQVELQGKTERLDIDASSAGQIDAYDLDAQKVVAEASSAGSLKISVAEDLTANASSGGSIRYHGNPNRSNTNSSSGGSVKKSN